MSSDNRTRMLVLGGYLGAGKTTLAVNLAKTLKERRDKSVAIIMNDQGDVLVDTEYSKDSGFDTCDIMGGCFCTNFDKFVSSARTLVNSGKPDVIIAEPIGTSTNIMSSDAGTSVRVVPRSGSASIRRHGTASSAPNTRKPLNVGLRGDSRESSLPSKEAKSTSMHSFDTSLGWKNHSHLRPPYTVEPRSRTATSITSAAAYMGHAAKSMYLR